MQTVDQSTGRTATAKSPDFVVVDDLAGMPVTDAELDAVEAFLGAALRDLLSTDSETPQTHAVIWKSRNERGAGR